MIFPAIPVRSTPAAALVATIIASSVGIGLANYLFFSRSDSFIWAIQESSDGWINANLILFLPLTILIVGGLILGWGKQRPVHLGLHSNWGAQLFGYLVGGWLAIQLLAVIATLVSGDGLTLHGAWREHGAGLVIGLLIAMVFGTAFFEDSVFRGYLLPQFYLRLEELFENHRLRSIAALLLCAIIFALWHLPTILLNRDLDMPGVFAALSYMLFGGIMLGLLYLRTGNLAVVIAIHALTNAPTLVVAAPLNGSFLAGLLGVAAILAGPLLIGHRWSLAIVRPTLEEPVAETMAAGIDSEPPKSRRQSENS